MNPWRTLVLAAAGFMILFFIAGMLVMPHTVMQAAVNGMNIWWDILFPSLMPFLIMAEIMLALGIVHGIGTLLDPLMRTVFRVSGKGGFVMSMGFAAGYPVGARLASQLWLSGDIRRDEGQRLAAFSSTSDPIFLIGAVAIGFFHQPELAFPLAVAHYGGAVCLGLILRLNAPPLPPAAEPFQGSLLEQAFTAMHRARIRDQRPLGTVLQDAVQSSLKIVFVIGGLVVFFSVVLELLTRSHLMNVLLAVFQLLFAMLQLPDSLATALTHGWFEVTLGAKASAQVTAELKQQVAVAAFILSWAGLSVHAQIMSIVQQTPFRYGPFMLARLLHGIISFAIIWFGWQPLLNAGTKLYHAMPVSTSMAPGAAMSVWSMIREAFLLFGVGFIICLLTALLTSCFFAMLRTIWKRVDKNKEA